MAVFSRTNHLWEAGGPGETTPWSRRRISLKTDLERQETACCPWAGRLRGGLWFALLLFVLLPLPGRASFIQSYAFDKFTTVNTNADGEAVNQSNGLLVYLIGGNNGSGMEGTTDWIITLPATGTVTFNFAFASFDEPVADFGGYILDGTFVLLADFDGQSGGASLGVAAGQIFGFRVATSDNTGEPGTLTLFNFSGPAGVDGTTGETGTPEPATGPILLAAGVLAMVYRRATHRKSKEEGRS